MADASRQLQQKSVGADVQSAATTYVPEGHEGCEPRQDSELTAGRNVGRNSEDTQIPDLRRMSALMICSKEV